jgi:hypothetical protein
MDKTDNLTNKRGIVVHYHLYKVGGSTIVEGLSRYFGRENVLEVDKHQDYAKEKAYNVAFFEKLANAQPTTMAYTAHRIVPNIHFSTKLDVYPITFVRHPLLRSNSVYRFELVRKDEWPRKHIARKYDFAGWIDWCLDSNQGIESRNVQSRLFSLNDHGHYMSDLKSDVRRGNLPLVYERLDSMPTVGVVEMFELSLKAINYGGEKYFPNFHIDNAQVNSTKIVDDWRAELAVVEKSLPGTLLDRYYTANADDLALFERYRLRLEEQHK